MKKAIFCVLDTYADWKFGYLAGQLNQSKERRVETTSRQSLVTSIGGFKTQVNHRIDQLPDKINLLVLSGGDSWSTDNQ